MTVTVRPIEAPEGWLEAHIDGQLLYVGPPTMLQLAPGEYVTLASPGNLGRNATVGRRHRRWDGRA